MIASGHEVSLDDVLGIAPKREETGPSSAGWHRLANFARCPQMFAYRWRLGLVPQVERTPLALGTAVHTGLAAFYQNKDPVAAIRALPERFSHCVRQAEELIVAYRTRYAGDRFDILAVEREFGLQAGGELFTRRLDLVYRYKSCAYIMDHKTAGQPAGRAKEARYDFSLATQAYVAEKTFPSELGIPFGGLVLNLIGTGPEPEFRRAHIAFKPRFVVRIPSAIAYYYRQIKQLENEDPWRYPVSGACHARYVCDYRDLCLGGPAYVNLYNKEEVRG